MKKNSSKILVCCLVILLFAGCNVFSTDSQDIEEFMIKLKEMRYPDIEILDMNKPVLAQWNQCDACIFIMPLDDEEKGLDESIVELTFDGPPNYDSYGKYGPNGHFVEKFIEQINEKRLNGAVLNSFIQKDLIITLEFSDGSKVVFDRYYKEIEENLDDYRKMFNRIDRGDME